MIDVLLADIVFDWTFLKPLIERDDGEKESNDTHKYWRKQKLVQKYITRLKKFPASNYGLWCDNYNQHWTLPYKSTSTPCSCWLCKGERYNRRKFKKETRLEIAMF